MKAIPRFHSQMMDEFLEFQFAFVSPRLLIDTHASSSLRHVVVTNGTQRLTAMHVRLGNAARRSRSLFSAEFLFLMNTECHVASLHFVVVAFVHPVSLAEISLESQKERKCVKGNEFKRAAQRTTFLARRGGT